MSTLNIKSPDDLKKLAGWEIKEAKFLVGNPPRLLLRISHIAADTEVNLIITPKIGFGLAGNVVTANAGFTLETHDVEIEEKKEE